MIAVVTSRKTETYDGFPCYRLRTAEAAKLIEDKLTETGRSFRTKIHTTRKRGREFLILLLDA